MSNIKGLYEAVKNVVSPTEELEEKIQPVTYAKDVIKGGKARAEALKKYHDAVHAYDAHDARHDHYKLADRMPEYYDKLNALDAKIMDAKDELRKHPKPKLFTKEETERVSVDNSGIDKPGRLNYAKVKASFNKKGKASSLTNNGYAPRPEGERRFAAKHLDNVVKREDPAKNGDDVYQATNIKAIDREAENHGYNPGDDADIYEETLGRHVASMHQHNDKGGVRVYYNHGYNEYRIVPYKKEGGKEIRSKEKSWGFTDDREDAEGTAKDMHKRLNEESLDESRGANGKIPKKRSGLMRAMDVSRQRDRIAGKLQSKFNRAKKSRIGIRMDIPQEFEYQQAKKGRLNSTMIRAGAAAADGDNEKLQKEVDNIHRQRGGIAKSERKTNSLIRKYARKSNIMNNSMQRAERVRRRIDVSEEMESLLNGISSVIVFEDGTTHTVSESDANIFADLFSTLDEENQELFQEMLLSSKESFDEVRDFAINHALGIENIEDDEDGI